MADITKDSKYGSGKSYKGQEAFLEGSLSGDIIIITKFAYDSAFNLEYLGEAKIGTDPSQSKWFLQKFIYDPAFNLLDIINAINIVNANASQVTVDVTSDANFLIITLPLDGDFSPVSSKTANTQQPDVLNLTTINNNIDCLPIHDTDRANQIRIRKVDIPAPTLAGIVDEVATPISATDLLITMNSKETKDYNRRRWDLRERYIYK